MAAKKERNIGVVVGGSLAGYGWSNKLAETMAGRLFGNVLPSAEPTADIVNLGISGQTLPNFLGAISLLLENYRDRNRLRIGSKIGVIAMIGASESSQPNASSNVRMEIDEFEEKVHELKGICSAFDADLIGVELTPCDDTRTKPVTATGIHFDNERMGLYSNVAERYIDPTLWVPTRKPLASKYPNYEYLSADGIHLSESGNTFIHQAVLRTFDNYLAS